MKNNDIDPGVRSCINLLLRSRKSKIALDVISMYQTCPSYIDLFWTKNVYVLTSSLLYGGHVSESCFWI